MTPSKELAIEIEGKVRSQHDQEYRQNYLARVAHEIYALPEEEWSALSTEVQEWFNSAADAIQDGVNIPDFDLVDEEPVATRQTSSSGHKGQVEGAQPGKPGKQKFSGHLVIRVLVDQNPKKPNTKAANKFSCFKDGMTVEQFRLEGLKHFPEYGRYWPNSELNFSLRHGYIRLEDPTEQDAG